MDEATGLVPAVSRAMRMLEILGEAGQSLGFEELLIRVALPRATAFRILRTLHSLGYVERVNLGYGAQWRLSVKLLSVGAARIMHMDLREEARESMRWLADKTNETVQLGILYDGRVMYVDHVRRIKPLGMYAELGLPLPINTSAAGMVLAAHLSPEELSKAIRLHGLPSQTPNTISDENAFTAHLAEIRARGFAVDDEMYAVGIRCIAAPICNYAREVVAAIGITGHVSSITRERLDDLILDVRTAGRDISVRLGAPMSNWTCDVG